MLILNHKRTVFAFFFVSFFCTGYAQDYISNFASAITINTNRTLDVTENISWVVPAGMYKHGIFREFPTIYKDNLGNRYTVRFDVKSILLDGRPVPYTQNTWQNGTVLKIGNPQAYITPGTHIVTISYTTDRQLGFFDTHDELYFNITGNGWRLPIQQALATIRFGVSIPANKLQAEGYTGYMGQQGVSYTSQINPDGTVTFKTTQPLLPGQGLTTVVTWPKGYIQPPTWFDKLSYFLRDNLSLLWLLLGLITLFSFFMVAYRKIKNLITGIVIPLFYPPKEMLPSTVRALKNFAFDDTAFASEIVNMAVHGLLTISQKDSWVSKFYTLTKNNTPPGPIHHVHHQLIDALFSESDTINLSRERQKPILNAYALLQGYARGFQNRYIQSHESTFTTAFILALLFVIPGLALSFHYGSVPLALACIPGYMILFVIFNYLLKSYTPQGQPVINEIDGFKMFLQATETERLKVIGTPPTKNPELWEKYLPYAMALGVEEQWSKQFAPVFAQLKEVGHTYVPLWYVGTQPFNTQSLPAFSSALSSSIAQSISASSRIPGTFSGSGGRGSSGGGGGGGGGGSW